MTTVVTEAVVDAPAAAAALAPRDGMVLERAVAPGRFEAVEGPVSDYRRDVVVREVPAGTHVTQTVSYSLAIPWFRWIFALPVRAELRRLVPRSGLPWWHAPDRLDVRSVRVLAVLCALSVIGGYTSTLLTQTITFAADEFGASKGSQGVALASVRFDILLSLAVVGMADRRGRRRAILVGLAAGVGMAAVSALSPAIGWLAGTQVVGRGFVTAAIIVIAVVGAEEMPASARAWATGLLAMASALGAGLCVLALPLADLDERGWRLLYLLPLLSLPLLRLMARELPESRRFARSHAEVPMAGHGRRFWLLAAASALLAVFTTPAAQFQNEYLREEQGYSAGRISLFTILTNTPGAIGIVVGGRIADSRGRRAVGALAVFGGVAATVLMYLVTGWPLWLWSTLGSIVGAAFVPALGVYGPELFPTSLRSRANAIILGVARVGSVAGLLAVGFLADRLDRLGAALAIMAIGPALVIVLVLVAFPETAHRELEELNPEDAADAT